MDEKFSITHGELIKAMNSLEDKLITAVENKIEHKIETKVNGKIKAIAETLEKQNIVLADIQKKIEPVLEDRRDKEGFVKGGKKFGGLVIGAAACIGALYAISQFITKIGNY